MEEMLLMAGKTAGRGRRAGARGYAEGGKGSFRRRARDFGEEVGRLGGEFGERMGRRGRRFGREVECRGSEFGGGFRRTFGLAGALFGTVFGIVFFAIGVWLLRFAGNKAGIPFLQEFAALLTANAGAIVLLIVVLAVVDRVARLDRRAFAFLAPLSKAAGFTVFLWLAANAVLLSESLRGVPALLSAALFINGNLAVVYGVIALIGYVAMAAWLATAGAGVPVDRVEADYAEVRHLRGSRREVSGKKRLYRSGRERMLGGVCGGIAEYLDVDPAIVRLAWVLATLLWGAGLLLYVILWIVVPRNPADRWPKRR